MKEIETVKTEKHQFANGDESILKEFMEFSDHQEFDGRILKLIFQKNTLTKLKVLKWGLDGRNQAKGYGEKCV